MIVIPLPLKRCPINKDVEILISLFAYFLNNINNIWIPSYAIIFQQCGCGAVDGLVLAPLFSKQNIEIAALLMMKKSWWSNRWISEMYGFLLYSISPISSEDEFVNMKNAYMCDSDILSSG
ncbi:MAG: hypothetical protein EZS28_032951 [Streblomastix strix]|uniref:Uncharacterized protein n=1 Tax=Streblomastix strix TaxID=222440 RepID=A0A5J4UMJ9_9EUKA|nr:MAG: hypothetical protein EZS28_032951 [Streblomastix strix]